MWKETVIVAVFILCQLICLIKVVFDLPRFYVIVRLLFIGIMIIVRVCSKEKRVFLLLGFGNLVPHVFPAVHLYIVWVTHDSCTVAQICVVHQYATLWPAGFPCQVSDLWRSGTRYLCQDADGMFHRINIRQPQFPTMFFPQISLDSEFFHSRSTFMWPKPLLVESV